MFVFFTVLFALIAAVAVEAGCTVSNVNDRLAYWLSIGAACVVVFLMTVMFGGA